MGLEATRNVILSAGGKHGSGGTILRGQPIPESVAQFVPLDAVTSTGAPASLAARQTPMPPPVGPAVKDPVPSEPVAPETPSVPTLVEAAPAVPGKDEIPTSRKKLMAMPRDAVIRVSADLGLMFASDASEREVKERLARELGF